MLYRQAFTGLLAGTASLLATTAIVVADDQTPTTLEKITITSNGMQDKGPVAKRARAGTKTDTPIVETPQSVSVVTSDQIKKQGSTSVSSALRYEPGITTGSRPGERFDSIYIRGFGGFGANANYIHYWNGLKLPTGINYNIPSVDPFFIDRIEITRGPASVLYGAGNPGGLVNLVSKKPEAEASHEVFTRFGNNGRAETGFDFTGPFDEEGQLLYRLTGVGRLYDLGVDNSDSQRVAIAPSVTWSPDADTTLTVNASYTRDPNAAISNWLPAVGTLQKNPNGQFSSSFFSGNPNYNSFSRKQATAGYEFEHHLDDVWTVRQNLRFMHSSTDFKGYSVTGWASASSCGGVSYLCLGRRATHYIEQFNALQVDNQAEADFNTGQLEHKLLMGLDYQQVDATSTYGNGSVSYINYLHPSYESSTNVALTGRQNQVRHQTGVYVQDQMKLDNWAFVLAGRHDWSSIDSTTTTLSSGSSTSYSTQDSAFTWKAGLLYQFDNGVAPYASYSTSFDPNMGTGYGGKTFKPTTGQQYEVGVKYQPTIYDAFFTVALYNLTQQNVLTTDTEHTSTNTTVTGCSSSTCQTQAGEVRSRGVELGAKFAITDNFSMNAAYTFADVEVTESTVASTVGKTPVGAPRHMVSLWGDYTLDSEQFAGLGFGAGVRYMGSTYGDATNTKAMKVPDYTLVDAAIHYDFGARNPKLKGLDLAVNATNLFNKKYVAACASETQCFLGTGRTIMATVSYKW
ncbi:TonB-dependent siderophore receptor [Rhizobium rhizogenes]|uniref:TonB-dependent siderophore receptor n=1 Tax=Rhizobium rhizogenes TaxID=359 RepID=UPI001572F082|nr:TonB-dependent siderophore receptor [Rhizobium rhizogenes]NTG89920.1 TonB-dependent siderophore receptor [Rhizobium rhizogenes]QRM41251.1 TonB-dependent siderophore receptor [Rhizobium rhizogenes]